MLHYAPLLKTCGAIRGFDLIELGWLRRVSDCEELVGAVSGETSGGFDGNTHSGYTNCGGTCPDMFLIKYNSDGVKQ